MCLSLILTPCRRYIPNFVNNVTRHSMNATQTQNVAALPTIGNHITTFPHVPLEHVELMPFRNHPSYGSLPSTGVITRRRLPLAFTEGNDTCDFQQDCRFGRRASRTGRQRAQTTGDILGTSPDSCGIRARVSPELICFIFQLYNRFTRRKYCAGISVPGHQKRHYPEHQRFSAPTQILPPVSTFSRIQNHQRRQTGQFVGLTRNGLTVDHAAKAMSSPHFR